MSEPTKTHCCNQGRNPPCECSHARDDGVDVLIDGCGDDCRRDHDDRRGGGGVGAEVAGELKDKPLHRPRKSTADSHKRVFAWP